MTLANNAIIYTAAFPPLQEYIFTISDNGMGVKLQTCMCADIQVTEQKNQRPRKLGSAELQLNFHGGW